MGVAFTCGLDKVMLPFVDRGIPVEYELVRSISTITQQKRKRIGVLMTDAQLYGQFNMQAMSSSPDWPIIAELERAGVEYRSLWVANMIAVQGGGALIEKLALRADIRGIYTDRKISMEGPLVDGDFEGVRRALQLRPEADQHGPG